MSEPAAQLKPAPAPARQPIALVRSSPVMVSGQKLARKLKNRLQYTGGEKPTLTPPSFIVSLFLGLVYLGAMMGLASFFGRDNAWFLQPSVFFMMEGLVFAFFWRRFPDSGLKSFSKYVYLFNFWTWHLVGSWFMFQTPEHQAELASFAALSTMAFGLATFAAVSWMTAWLFGSKRTANIVGVAIMTMGFLTIVAAIGVYFVGEDRVKAFSAKIVPSQSHGGHEEESAAPAHAAPKGKKDAHGTTAKKAAHGNGHAAEEDNDEEVGPEEH